MEKLKKAYKDLKPGSAIARQTREVVTQSEEILNAWVDAATDAIVNYNLQDGQKNNTPDGVQFSMRGKTQQEVTANYQAEVDSILNMQDTTAKQLIVGYTPSVYESIGMPSLPLTIGSGHVYSAAKTEAEAKRDGNFHKGVHYHGLGDTAIKNIYSAIQNPVMVIAAKDVNKNASPMRSTHSVVAIADIGTSGKSLLVPIEITAERNVNGTRMDVNTISSVYEKSVQNLVTEAIAMENTGEIGVFYAKKEALTLPGAGVQFPVQLQQSIASNGILHHLSEKVNMNISETTQSQQFKRWFGDWQNDPANASKVVTADGTPMVMYHGSPAQFAIFEKKKAKSSGMYGRGFYFTNSETHAGQYGNRYSVYLNIRNPLEHGRNMVSRQQVQNYLESVAENEDYSIENYGTYDVEEVTDNIMGSNKQKDAFDVIQDINVTAIGDMVEAVELFNEVNGTKFDGIVVPTETVAFYPSQIKSATDNVGTFDAGNPDIRFSQRSATQLERQNEQLRQEKDELKKQQAESIKQYRQQRDAADKAMKQQYEKQHSEVQKQYREQMAEMEASYSQDSRTMPPSG